MTTSKICQFAPSTLLNPLIHHPDAPFAPWIPPPISSRPRVYNTQQPIWTSDPSINECKLVDYRGKKCAAFIIAGETMLCLPQAFDLFLKNLVGGQHTIHCKLKRLDIVPLVCNVEQIRVLRGLGALQPGVNRCKLLSCNDFDKLYEDCTNGSSRAGRPPKRSGSETLSVIEKQLWEQSHEIIKKRMESSEYFSAHDKIFHSISKHPFEMPQMYPSSKFERSYAGFIHDKGNDLLQPQNLVTEKRNAEIKLSTSRTSINSANFSNTGDNSSYYEDSWSGESSFGSKFSANASENDKIIMKSSHKFTPSSVNSFSPKIHEELTNPYSIELLLQNIEALLVVALDNAKMETQKITNEKAELQKNFIKERKDKTSLEMLLSDERKLRAYEKPTRPV